MKPTLTVREYPTKKGRSYNLSVPISNVEKFTGFDYEGEFEEEAKKEMGPVATSFVEKLKDIGGLSGLIVVRKDGFTVGISDSSLWDKVEKEILAALIEVYHFEDIEIVRQ